jgi:predicted GH43/DUF377 family glycosyl hydrolase
LPDEWISRSGCYVDGKVGACKKFRTYNPSLVIEDGIASISLRASNWSLCRWSGRGKPYVDYETYHSHVGFFKLDVTSLNALTEASPLSLGDLWNRTQVAFFEVWRQGLEDSRLLNAHEAVVTYAAEGARAQPTKLTGGPVGSFRVAVVDFRRPAESFTPLQVEPDDGDQQKNFGVFDVDGERFLVFKIAPRHVVARVAADGRAVIEDALTTDAPVAIRSSKVRGGTLPLRLPDGRFLAVAHVVRGRQYTHIFYIFGARPPFAIEQVSQEWCMARHVDGVSESSDDVVCETVQFVSGAALMDGTLYMTYGVMDCDARITRVRLDDVMEMMTPQVKPEL